MMLVLNSETLPIADEIIANAQRLREAVLREDDKDFTEALTEHLLLVRHLSVCIEPDE